MKTFHVSRNGQQLGTFAEEQAKEFFAQGRIALTDLVWSNGMTDWLPAGQVFASTADAVSGMPPLPPPLHSGGAHPPEPFLHAHAKPGPSQIPVPPNLHWALVLLFSILSFGIFMIIWIFVQFAWVRKIDPKSNATNLAIAYIVLVFGGQAVASAASPEGGWAVVGALMILGGLVVWLFAIYSARRSMIDYYNTVEPIRLKLGGVMTFFFNVFYLQHHMTRIANWKLGDRLAPQ